MTSKSHVQPKRQPTVLKAASPAPTAQPKTDPLAAPIHGLEALCAADEPIDPTALREAIARLKEANV